MFGEFHAFPYNSYLLILCQLIDWLMCEVLMWGMRVQVILKHLTDELNEIYSIFLKCYQYLNERVWIKIKIFYIVWINFISYKGLVLILLNLHKIIQVQLVVYFIMYELISSCFPALELESIHSFFYESHVNGHKFSNKCFQMVNWFISFSKAMFVWCC